MRLIPINKKCLDCKTKLIDEFSEVAYVGCSGCPRIYKRR